MGFVAFVQRNEFNVNVASVIAGCLCSPFVAANCWALGVAFESSPFQIRWNTRELCWDRPALSSVAKGCVE